MDALSPLPAATAILVALVTVFSLKNWVQIPPANARYASIDGLRGYLAFFVFLHHSSIWYFYLRTKKWQVPESNLYTNFGQSSVAIFFMITGFLFYSKILNGHKRPIDWSKLYLSRALRLGPLYYFAVAILVLIIAILSNFTLNASPLQMLKSLIGWGSFTTLGSPDLNGINNTGLILAGVFWSLKYEWLFYFSLPLLALTVRTTVPWPYLLFSFTFVTALALAMHPSLAHVTSFASGIITAFLVRSDAFRARAASSAASLLVIACIAVAMFAFKSSYSFFPLALLSVAFALIACGNSLFGLLTNNVSRLLGELTYGIYLLQGIVLFVTFKFVIGFKAAAALSPLEHWLIIMCCTPILILICFCTFKTIEAPAMANLQQIHTWMQDHFILRWSASKDSREAARLGETILPEPIVNLNHLD